MADTDNDHHVTEFPPPTSSPSTPIPLNLSGPLAGDTVQVQGDTGDLQFSVQFKVHRKEHYSGEPSNFPDRNTPETGIFPDSVQSPPSSLHLTPTPTDENEDCNADANALSKESWSGGGGVMTRLRSGVLSPVNYYGVCRGGFSTERRKKVKKGRGNGENVFDKMLKRRSFPIRPCNSYAFFLMANWGVVKRCSFEETSKRLSKQWYKLPRGIMKEYEEMALKDNERYKRQCVLLKNDVEQESVSGLRDNSN